MSPRTTPFTSQLSLLLLGLSNYNDHLWPRRSNLNFNWSQRSVGLLCSPSFPPLKLCVWFCILLHQLLSSSHLLLKPFFLFIMSSHNENSSTKVISGEGSVSPKRPFIIAPNLETASPPPVTIHKGPFSIPLDSAPTRVRFSVPDVQVLAEENKKFTLVGKIFGDPISPQNIQTRFIGSWTDFQGPFSIDHVGYGWFKVAFTVEEDMQFVLDNRPWFVQGQIFHLQRWFPTFDPANTTIDHLLVWVRLPFLPFHFWNDQTITKLAEIIRRCNRLDTTTLESHMSLFAHACVEINLSKKIPRVLDLKPDPHSDKIIMLHLHYETLFECCFYCGLVVHTLGACPGKVFDRHYLMVDRYPQEDRTYPANFLVDPKLNEQIPEGVMLVFPQSRRATAAPAEASRGHTQSSGATDDQSVDGWTKVTLKNKGKGPVSKPSPSSYVRKHGVSFRDVASGSPTRPTVPRRAPTPFRPPNQVLTISNSPLIISLVSSSSDSSDDCEETSGNDSDMSYESLDSLHNFPPDNFSLLNEDLNNLQDHDDLLPLHDYGIFDSNDNQEYRVREAVNSNLAMDVSDKDEELFEPAVSDYGLPNQEEFENSAFVDPNFRSPRKRGRDDSINEASTSITSPNP